MNQLIGDNSIATLRNYMRSELRNHFDERERENVIAELFKHFSGWSRSEVMLHNDERLSESQLLQFHFALKRLVNGEPLQYVLGTAHFFGLELKVSKHVLIPRPETEELVRLAIQLNTHSTPRILDIGTGSGCMAIALKKKIPAAEVHACDISADALAYAKSNAIANNCSIHFYQLDILKQMVEEQFDIIVSNPPYVLRSEMAEMHQRVVAHEPHVALFVEESDALIFYRRIVMISKTQLAAGGFVLCEMHEAMEAEMSKLMLSERVEHFQFHKDMQGKTRFVLFKP